MGKFLNRAVVAVLTASLALDGGISKNEIKASSVSTVSSVSSNDSFENISIVDNNNQNLNVDENNQNITTIDGEEINRVNGYIEDKRDFSYLLETQKYLEKKNKNSNKGLLKASNEDELPSSFDLRDEGLVSPVANQGDYGTCWAQTIAANVENTLIENNPTVRINPYQIVAAFFQDEDNNKLFNSSKDAVNYEDISDYYNAGGLSNLADIVFLAGKAPCFMDEKDREDETKAARVYDDSELIADLQIDSIDYGSELYVQADKTRDYEIDMVKRLICDDKKTVSASYDGTYTAINTLYYNIETNAQYCDLENEPNHAVAIVG